MSNRRQRETSKQVHVRLTERTQSALDTLHTDVDALRAMVEDMVAGQQALLEMLKAEVVAFVSEVANGDGVTVFDREDEAPGYGKRLPVEGPPVTEPKPQTMRQPGELPDAMQHTPPRYEKHAPASEEDRVRETPFTRAPRYVQVAWLKEIMADGGWYAAHGIAREYATDERHYRYMRGAVTARLKEMHEEGLVERRDSHVRGSMFQYRLKEE